MKVLFGEVPKLAEGTPLERVQVVNSGARVQIPPSPLTAKVRSDRVSCRHYKMSKKVKKVLDRHWNA